MKTLKRMAGLGPLALVAFVLAAPRPAAADAHITVINADGPNEAFNDPTPAAPYLGSSTDDRCTSGAWCERWGRWHSRRDGGCGAD